MHRMTGASRETGGSDAELLAGRSGRTGIAEVVVVRLPIGQTSSREWFRSNPGRRSDRVAIPPARSETTTADETPACALARQWQQRLSAAPRCHRYRPGSTGVDADASEKSGGSISLYNAHVLGLRGSRPSSGSPGDSVWILLIGVCAVDV